MTSTIPTMKRIAGLLLGASSMGACDRGVDAGDANAYYEALEKQTDHVVAQAEKICADESALAQHGAIQGFLRDLNQYRLDFEGQMRCTRENRCAAPERAARPPPVFRAEPAAPDPAGAALSKKTFAELRNLIDDDPPKAFRQTLLECQSEAMAVTASAVVLVTTCTTQPQGEALKRETARLAEARKSFAAALRQAKSAAR